MRGREDAEKIVVTRECRRKIVEGGEMIPIAITHKRLERQGRLLRGTEERERERGANPHDTPIIPVEYTIDSRIVAC